MKPVIDPTIAAARYEHGTNARYTLAKCRCFSCKVGHANYRSQIAASRRMPYRLRCIGGGRYWEVRAHDDSRVTMRTTVRAAAEKRLQTLNRVHAPKADNDLVNPAKALRHIKRLQAAGVGYKTIAARADLGKSAVANILNGDAKRIKRATADAILGVAGSPVGTTNIDAGPTWLLLEELLAAGYRKGFIGQQLGGTRPALQIRRDRVTVITADKVRALHARLMTPSLPVAAAPNPAAPSAKDRLANALAGMAPDEFFTRLSRFEGAAS